MKPKHCLSYSYLSYNDMQQLARHRQGNVGFSSYFICTHLQYPMITFSLQSWSMYIAHLSSVFILIFFLLSFPSIFWSLYLKKKRKKKLSPYFQLYIFLIFAFILGFSYKRNHVLQFEAKWSLSPTRKKSKGPKFIFSTLIYTICKRYC